MTRAANVVGLGTATVQSLQGVPSLGLTARVMPQADATPIQSTISEFTTVPSGGACLLPKPTRGDTLTVVNRGANTLLIYPPIGSSLDYGTVNAAYSLQPDDVIQFIAQDDLNYFTNTNYSSIKASQIPIVDAGNYYTDKNVEGALQELGVNEVKQITSAAALRVLTPANWHYVFILGSDGGLFYRDASDTTSSEDGGTYCGTIIRDTDYATAGVWKRINVVLLDPSWYGAVGDGDYLTGAGTDNAAAIALLQAASAALRLPVQLKSGAQYKTTAEIVLNSNLKIVGDDEYSPIIFAAFAASGKIIVKSPATGSQITNIHLSGFTVARYGAHAEHGLLIDNINGLTADLRVIASSSAVGGAFGVSSFYPQNRPSKNCNVKAVIDNGVNFGLQFGNVDSGSMQVIATNCMREAIGLEPYTLGKYDFSSTNVTGDVLNWPAHGLTTGYPLIYAKQGTTGVPSMTRTSYYFVIVIDSDNIKIADSKEQAIATTPVALSLAGTPAGTQRILKCGVLRNIQVLPSSVDTGDIPAGGTLTGVVVCTSSSGGYHESIVIGPVDITERNPTSGSYGFMMSGCKDVPLRNQIVTGVKSICVRVAQATINSVRDASGNITPSPAPSLLPDVIVENILGTQFTGYGLSSEYGRCIARHCDFRSNISGAVGIYQSPAAEAAGSYTEYSTVYCPNGTPFNLVVGMKNYNLNDTYRMTTDFLSKRLDRGSVVKNLTGAGGAISVASVTNQQGGTTTYMGKIVILAMTDDTSGANRARYEITVDKAYLGATPAAALLNSQGLTTGANATFPSFTWSMSGDTLQATPVASTSTTGTWIFFLQWENDLRCA